MQSFKEAPVNPTLLPLVLSSKIGSVDTGQQFMYQKNTNMIGATLGSGQHIESWCESSKTADTRQQTDSSTDVDDTDDKNRFHAGKNGALVAVDSMDQSKTKAGGQKTLRRLAQNREAAKKSRLRKIAYVQQLENSRLRLEQLGQELQSARQQVL